MDTLTFLRHVLPSEGHYVLTVINEGAPQQAFFGTVEDLATNCIRSDQRGNNTYYAISTFKKRGSRKQENVHLTKVLTLDVDCAEDKPYLTQLEGAAALQTFLRDTQLPKPMVVSSGRGLHVYWVLDHAIPPEEWTPLAERLKQACLQHAFRVDIGLVANSALVLRPTGTHNPKNGAEVKLYVPADTVEVQTFSDLLQSYIPATATNMSQPAPPTASAKGSGLLAHLAVDQDFPPAAAHVVASKCKIIEWATTNQDKVSEPLWYSILGVAAYCMDPEQTARIWSNKHPNYNEVETLAKLHHWKTSTTGPATCTRLEQEKPNGCKGCPAKGKITTPAMLGLQYAAVTASTDAPDKLAALIPVPYPFGRVKKNNTTEMVKSIDGTHVEICPFEIYPTGYGRDESLGFETVRFKWHRQHAGWQDLVFRQAYLNDGNREFATAIADQGIVLKGEAQTKGFQQMLRAYMDELRSIRSMTNVHGSMGWKENFTQFVVGNRLYRCNNGDVTVEEISLTSASNRLGHELYGQKGTIEEWRDATKILEDAKMPHHIFALGQSFAAPLWVFTGLNGLTVSLHGPTGAGKSLIQLWMQSVWGNPAKLHFAAKFTQNALFNRLGIYCNLPMTIDETTMMDDRIVGDFCYWVSQGRDKARLNIMAEERELKEWATSVVVSTNRSFVSKMFASGLETDAQMARLMELPIPKHPVFEEGTAAGSKLYHFVLSHYGAVGDAYVKALLRIGEAGLRKRIEDTTKGFRQLYDCKFTGPERYWEMDMILTHVGCEIAKEAGLLGCNHKVGIRWAVSKLGALRAAASENTADAFKIIHEYVNENAADTIIVMHTKDMAPMVDQQRLPRGEVKIRFDIYRDAPSDKFTKGTMMLVQKPFKMAVALSGYDYGMLRKEIADEGIDVTPSSRRGWLGRDTGLKLGQQYVFCVNLNHDKMKGYLDDFTKEFDELLPGEMVAIS